MTVNTFGQDVTKESGSIVPTVPPSPVVPPTVPPPVTPQLPETPKTPTVQADTTNTGKPGYDVFGNPTGTGGSDIQQARISGGTIEYTNPDGSKSLYYKYDNTPVGTSTPSTQNATTNTDTSSPTLSDPADRQVLAQAQAEYQTQAKSVQDTILNIQNGVTPLTAGENAQVSGLQQQFQQLIEQQKLVNTGATGLGNIRGYQTGAAEYDPTFQVKTIGSIVSAGAAKIVDLQIQEAAAVAQLTQSFKDNDIKAVKDAYVIYQDAAKQRQDALQKTIDDTTQAIKDAQDAKIKADTYALDVQKFQQTKDQAAFDNALKTEQEAFDEKYKTNTLALDQFKAGMGAGGGGGGVTQSAQLTPSGNPDPATQKQVLDQITAKYGPMTAQAIQGLANYSINPADWSSRAGTKGLSRADAVSLAQMYDPTYNDAMYSVRATYMKNLASSQTGTVGSAINSANKAINHLTAFVTDISKLPNGPSSKLNAFDNAVTLNQGVRQNIAAAQTEGLGVAEELAKFFKGSGTVDVASIDAWKSQLSTNASPADVRGLTQGAVTLLAGQLETLAEQYQSTMGKAAETDFLNPSARASLSSLKNQGYEVNIPGITYTDKASYLANGGSTDALTSAYQILVNANDPNNPPTPENVLELAQLQ